MRKQPQPTPNQQTDEKRTLTPTFLLEVPLRVTASQARRLRAHLEAARQLYNAILSEGQRRLHRMRADPAWQVARAIPRIQKQERKRAFGALRRQYGFSEYALHDAAKGLNCTWIADHVDAVLAQTLATRAYRALNRVCLGQARRVRFRSRSRGISSVENKRKNTGLRFVLQRPEEGNAGYLLWQDDRLEALIDWKDPVVSYGLTHRIKYARLLVRQASSARALGADEAGQRYFVQLALEGIPYQKPKHQVGSDTVGLDLGPSTIAIVPREGPPRLEVLCSELAPDAQAIRRLQRQMDRQRRANNPDNYDERGRIKKRGKQRLSWKNSKRYLATRRRKATRERKLAAHRKGLHGRLVHEIVAVGKTVITEQISYRAWQKQFGRSVGLRAPGMFIEMLRRTVASTGGTLVEVPTRSTKLSQFCHGCGKSAKKPLWQRWHECPCGIGPIQRDLYSAFLAAYLDPVDLLPSCARYRGYWEGREPGLRAAYEQAIQRASAGQHVPRSFGIPGDRVRLPKSPGLAPQEPACRETQRETWKQGEEPPGL
jgi:transposase